MDWEIELALAEMAKRARRYVYNRMRAGVIPHPRQLRCRDCGCTAHVYDHIAGYWPRSVWGLVEPVCEDCHRARHRLRAGVGYA